MGLMTCETLGRRAQGARADRSRKVGSGSGARITYELRLRDPEPSSDTSKILAFLVRLLLSPRMLFSASH